VLCGTHLRFLLLRRGIVEERLRAGRVLEGHGDLRPEHIYLEGDKPVVIDGVEFSLELRTIDAADELCFLAMECERLGNKWIGRRLLDIYRQRSGDEPDASLLNFYKSYRCCVRAKVAALRGRQLAPEKRWQALATAGQYVSLAETYTRDILPPLLLVVHGLMGTGKTTLARALADALTLQWLATDAVRRRIYPSGGPPLAYGEGIYAEPQRRRVYDELLRLARTGIDAGESVVLDGTFLTNESRRAAIETARNSGALPLLINCTCPAEIARQRIATRQAAGERLSDARAELLAEQQSEEEPLSPDLPQMPVDSTLPIRQQVQAVVQHLAKL
jgi:predicted kinase